MRSSWPVGVTTQEDMEQFAESQRELEQKALEDEAAETEKREASTAAVCSRRHARSCGG